ncbi:MAG: ABC transporter substrate-binding protein [Candidatus Scalindua sp.]|jgi:phospholipid transport system substrate-binding protein|nr:ABC transporter substrate-binding protein [Candidatus Scalindua sp.]
MKYKTIVCIVLISIFAITVKQSYLWAGEPSVLVKEVILNEYSFSDIENIHERRTKQWEEISPSLDFEMISKRVMGEHWEKCIYEQKCGFVELFTNYLKSTYLKKPNPIFGKKIISIKEKQYNGFAKVQTILLSNSGKEISTDFYLMQENGEWKICDLAVEGVSLVNNYRSQILSTLIRGSYEGLLETMKEKQVNALPLLVSEQSAEIY